MDFNIVTLEIADLIVHFNYYDTLVSEVLISGPTEDQTKIRNKNKEHLTEFFADTEFYNQKRELRPLSEMKGLIITKLTGMKSKDIHDLVEKLEKDAKRIKKLYKSLTKK